MKKHMMLKKIILYTLFVSWMAVILLLSSEPASESKAKSGFILEKIEPVIMKMADVIGSDTVDRAQFHYWVRKNAHMFNYFVLALLAYAVFKTAKRFSMRQAIIYAWLIATGFACIDEFYQTFIPGRSGEIKDVLIDSVGAALGVLTIGVVTKIKSSNSRKN